MLTESLEHMPIAHARQTTEISALLLRIQGEYHEMPGLKVTEPQAQRLWGLDGNRCSLVLAALVERRFLKRTALGTYLRASD